MKRAFPAGLFVLSLHWQLLAAAETIPPREWYSTTNEWEVAIGSECDSSAAVGPDGTLYLGTFMGRLFAVGSNGRVKWKFDAGREIKSSPALAEDGTLYFGSRDRNVYAVREAQRQWIVPTAGWVDSSPALARDGTVYVGSWDKKLYAISRAGKVKWHFLTSGEVTSSPAIGLDGTIYFGSHDKNFYALAPDGTERWRFATAGPIVSSPAVARDGEICFSSVDGYLYFLRANGELVWRLHTGGITESSPVIGEDGAIFIGVNTFVWNISVEGKKRWDRTGDDLIDSTACLLSDGTLCWLSRYGSLVNMRQGDCWMNWAYYLGAAGSVSPVVGETGIVYVPQPSSRFVALKAKVPLAKAPWPKFRGNPRNTGNVRDVP